MYIQNALYPSHNIYNQHLLSSTVPTTSSTRKRSMRKSRKTTVMKNYFENSNPVFNLNVHVNEVVKKVPGRIDVGVSQVLNPED